MSEWELRKLAMEWEREDFRVEGLGMTQKGDILLLALRANCYMDYIRKGFVLEKDRAV